MRGAHSDVMHQHSDGAAPNANVAGLCSARSTASFYLVVHLPFGKVILQITLALSDRFHWSACRYPLGSFSGPLGLSAWITRAFGAASLWQSSRYSKSPKEAQ